VLLLLEVFFITFVCCCSIRGYQSLVDIVVCTPGRLVDHINKTPGFDLTHLRFLVSTVIIIIIITPTLTATAEIVLMYCHGYSRDANMPAFGVILPVFRLFPAILCGVEAKFSF